MRLKSLEIVGFKSFPDRTIINFEDGVTGIVGPNGCGKSNVVDAIRWVMGEQSAKHLRGLNMGDVIFNGTESRTSMGMASVYLTFDNSDGRAPAEYSDYTEITVGRRLYRSGESEYYINKTPCRLKDITEIFLGTGIGAKAYAIVEQGMIGQILNAKPEDRRVLIEEAAGISKFKMRKEAALRKMDATKSNVARLSDILTELTRQMNSLYRQAKKAERYKLYSDELKELELAVSAHDYDRLTKEFETLSGNLQKLKEEEASCGAKLAQSETEVESSKINLSELEKELDELQSVLYEKQNEVQLVEADISYRSKDVEKLTSEIQRWVNEIKDLKSKLSVWQEELTTVNIEKLFADLNSVSAEEKFNEIDCDFDNIQNRHAELTLNIEETRKKIFDCVEAVSTNNSKLEQLKRRDIELTGWIAKDQSEIDNIDKQIAELNANIDSRSNEVVGTKQLKLELETDFESAGQTLQKQKEELFRLEELVSEQKEKLQNKRSRLMSLTELDKNFEGYKEGVRAVLKRHEDVEEFNGVVGTINEIVETKPEFETAVGAVLGEKLQYVVVRSHEVGVDAIDYLKSQVSGRSTFVPVCLRSADADTQSVMGEGVIGPLVEHVNYADDYKKIVNYLFKDVVLVEDLKKALNLWSDASSGCTLVTLDGDVVDPAGLVTGGSGGESSKQLMVHRREIKELTSEVSVLTAELNVEQEKMTRCRERVRAMKENIEKLEKGSRDEEIRLINQEKDLKHLEQELSYYKSQRDKLTVEVAALAEEQNTVHKDHEISKDEFENAVIQKEELELSLNEKKEKESELRESLQDMVGRRTELNVQVKSEKEKTLSLDREIDRFTTSIAEAKTSIALKEHDIKQATLTIKFDRISVDIMKNNLHLIISYIDEFKTKHVEIKEKYDARLSVVREKEVLIRELRRSHDEKLKEVHELDIEHTQRQEKLNYMIREMFDRYRVSLDRSYSDFLTHEIDFDKSSTRVVELKEKLEKISSVNIDAISEYEELKVRNDFLQTQHADLVRSLDDLHKAIQKINKTSKIRFSEAFESVNERFQKLFPKLFRGGKARLVLTDENNPLESGVDIVAQPPGKKLQSVTLLSGGEKALTAVALIFAMFLHRPSPFCLLDEVDAPLDDANIDRFNEMIREMTKLSQFILITHNKRTMELADVLYGVTMEERGASKVISLSLTDKKTKEEAAA